MHCAHVTPVRREGGGGRRGGRKGVERGLGGQDLKPSQSRRRQCGPTWVWRHPPPSQSRCARAHSRRCRCPSNLLVRSAAHAPPEQACPAAAGRGRAGWRAGGEARGGGEGGGRGGTNARRRAPETILVLLPLGHPRIPHVLVLLVRRRHRRGSHARPRALVACGQCCPRGAANALRRCRQLPHRHLSPFRATHATQHNTQHPASHDAGRASEMHATDACG